MLTNDQLIEKTGISIEEFIIKGASDFKFWVESLTQFEIQPFHLEWVNLFYNTKRSCIIAARTLGKSTVLSQLFCIWMAFYERDKNFLIVSHNMPLSTKHIVNMRLLIESIELLNQMKPEDRGYSWTKTEINTSTGCSIFCKPYSDNIRGYTVPDYIQIDEASYLMDHLIYERAILPMAQRRNANICICGTPRTEVDLLANARLPGSGYVTKEYPIMSNGIPIWNKVFPMARIEQIKKEMGDIGFGREYMLKILSEDVKSIPSELILNALDTTIKLIHHGDKDAKYYMGIDLAISPRGDYSVYTIVEKTKGKDIILRAMERYRGVNPNAQVELIANLYNRFKPVTGYIDISVCGPAILNSLKSDYGINIQPFKFEPSRRNELFSNLISLFGNKESDGHIVNNLLTIPRDTSHPQTMALSTVLIHELSGIHMGRTKTNMETFLTTTRNDDAGISLMLACKAATEARTGEMHIATIAIKDTSSNIFSGQFR